MESKNSLPTLWLSDSVRLSRQAVKSTARRNRGNESGIAPGEFPGRDLIAGRLVELFGKFAALRRVVPHGLQERIAALFVGPGQLARAFRREAIIEFGGRKR